MAQRDLASMHDLMDICLLWVAIREGIKAHVGAGSLFVKLETMFQDGTLDPELKAHAKTADPSFDLQKLSFVLECKGQLQDEELEKAQSKINSALQTSLQAGFSLFETNLANDQLQHRRTEIKAEDEDGDNADGDTAGDAEPEGEIDSDDENSKNNASGGDALLRDFNYRLTCMLQEAGRNLHVRNAMVTFEPSSVYGSRSGYQQVLLITSNDKNNIFRRSRIWKVGVIQGVTMLGRAEMLKPARASKLYGGEARFTKVQEMKQDSISVMFLLKLVESFCPAQYCGGMNFIAKLVEGLQPGATEVPLVLIDAMGFDGWPGKKIACATICHTNADASFVSSTLAGKVFSMARSNELNIAAFPNFSSAMAEIKQFQRSPQPDYQVCVCLGDGSLIVRESLIQFWSKKHTSFLEQLTNLVDDHNKEFNPKGLKRGAEPNNEETNEEVAETPKKRLRLTTAKTYAELEVMPLNELLKVLEDNGEVNYQVAEHELTKDAAGNFSIKPLSSVCFVLDALKPKKKKAKVASAMTFGAKVNFAKLRGSSNIRIIWRLRRFT
ncbi:Uncharacterized protein SCF082_LOCUS12841 [Durusdinium trenchii]|uniref:Uncharacterized protein n=1 Tax=Durusdinium trenchii TaxID=1381693 RepID=A0ABP0JMZ4_9DINO